MFERAIGTKMTHVQYKSTGDVVNSMLGGHIDLAIDSMTTVGRRPRGHGARDRRLDAARSASAPDVPAIGETVKGYEATPGRACSRRPGRRNRSSRRSRPRPSASGISRR